MSNAGVISEISRTRVGGTNVIRIHIYIYIYISVAP